MIPMATIAFRKIHYYIFVALLWGAIQPGNAQEQLSFSGAIQKALENNYQIRMAEKDTAISANNNTRGAAGMWPSITLSASQNNRWTDQSKPQPSTTFSNEISPSVNLKNSQKAPWRLW